MPNGPGCIWRHHCSPGRGDCLLASWVNSWEAMVPDRVADLIKRRGFFGYIRPGARD
jgi:hypothetical protein